MMYVTKTKYFIFTLSVYVEECTIRMRVSTLNWGSPFETCSPCGRLIASIPQREHDFSNELA